MLLGDPESASMSSSSSASSDSVHLNSLLCSLSLLNDKVNQLQSMVSVTTSSSSPSFSVALAGSMATLIQEIMVTSSTMMFSCQQMAIPPPTTATTTRGNEPNFYDHMQDGSSQFATEPNFYWYDNDTYKSGNCNGFTVSNTPTRSETVKIVVATGKTEAESYEIVELDAADLLAKYTHYCQVCAKGFKRDANLRMHMRAHGEEYKSSAALSKPEKSTGTTQEVVARKYSCPQEGCRWNKMHRKFQPLKSMICAKNHYRRSHCPKMYVCKRCSVKQFSVLSDLRTHEKHCGDRHKWRCSCGTTFSRKDKLVGHVSLFVGHVPVVLGTGSSGNVAMNAIA